MRALPKLFCLPLLLTVLLGITGPAQASVRQLGPDAGIAVGVLYPATGSLSSAGASAYVAFESALTDMNAYLSQHGYGQGIKLLLYDTGDTAEGALAGLKELDSLGVSLVIGPYTSAQCELVAPYAGAYDILLLSPTATAASLAAEDNVLRLSLDDTHQAEAIATLMWQEGRRVYVPIWRGDTWGDGLESQVASNFAALGGTVLEGVRYDLSGMDYNDLLLRLNTTVSQAVGAYGADKVAVNMLSFEEGIGILAGAGDYSSLGLVNWYGSDGTARNQQLLENTRAAAFASLTGFANPMTYESVETSTTPRLVLEDIVLRESLAAALGGSPSAGTYESWDAVWLAGLGYASGGVSADSSQLRQAIGDLASNYVGMSGVLQLDEAGDRVYGNYGFFKVSASGSGYGWKLSSTYSWAYGDTDGLKMVSPWSPPNVAGAPATYQVGVLLNSGGHTELANNSVQTGLEEAVQAINTHLSLYGYPTQVNLLTYDSHGDVNQAIAGVRSLAAQGAKVIIGPLTSTESAAVLAVASELGVVLVSPGSDATSLSQSGDNLYRMVPDVQTQGKATAKLMWEQGRRALTCVYLDDVWGRDLAEATAKAFRDLGGVVLGQYSYTADSGSYNQALSAVEQCLQGAGGQYGKDQLAVQLSSMEEGVALLGQTSAYAGLAQAYWYGSESLSQSTALVGDGSAAKFAAATNLTTIQYAMDITGLVNGIPHSLPLAALEARTQSALGSAPQTYAYTAYDGLWLTILAAVDSNWSTSASALGAQLRTTASGYTGLSNALTLNSSGDRRYGNFDFLSPSSGSWQTLYTYYTNPLTGGVELVSR